MKKALREITYAIVVMLVVSGFALTPAEAAYKPKLPDKVSGNFKKEVQNVLSYLKGLPKLERWTFMAEHLGILFRAPNGAIGHTSGRGGIDDGSRFIGSDGREYDASAELQAMKRRGGWATWEAKLITIKSLGRDIVFSKLANEVTALVLANAKYHLKKMGEEHPVLRDMYLAYLAQLHYLPDGGNPYKKELVRTDPGPLKQPVRYYDTQGCNFVDTSGEEHCVDEIYKLNSALGGDRWQILDVCTQHVGRKDILDLFPDDVKMLRINYKKKMQEINDEKDSEES